MDWPRLDTSSWNLSLGVVATSLLAACGPLVVLEGDTDTDTSAETDTDPSPTSRPTDPSQTDTLPSGCDGGIDCGPGYQCIDDVCVPDYDYCDYGGTGGCCYGDCYYYECYSDEECGSQALCVSDYGYNACAFPLELPDCDSAPEVVPLELPQLGEGEILSLSFVEVDGDAASDLVVGRIDGAELHRGANAAPPGLLPLPPGVGAYDAISGDFDADGNPDLVVSTTEATLVLLRGDGAGGFTLTEELAQGLFYFDLAALQWNDDGALDVAYRTSTNAVRLQLNGGTGAFENGVSLEASDPYSVVLTDFGGDGYGDLVVQDSWSTQVFLGDSSGDLHPDVYLWSNPHGTRVLSSDPIDASEPHEVLGHTRLDGWLLLELWGNGGGSPQRFSLPGDDTLAAMGDFDGDGDSDVLATGGATISYVRSTAEDGYPTLACRTSYFTGLAAAAMEVGDFDGNGRADVALGGGGSNRASIMLSF